MRRRACPDGPGYSIRPLTFVRAPVQPPSAEGGVRVGDDGAEDHHDVEIQDAALRANAVPQRWSA
jgi:hypothetical protein